MSIRREQIDQHSKNVEKLLFRCESLDRKVTELTSEIDVLSSKLKEKEAAYDDLLSKFRIFKMSMSLNGSLQDKEEITRYIDHLVTEIDACIAMLNE